uniref:non-specific serine/threonine protein kinase n=1 Tax=Hordeum vulgare subsp. vulgare TaxID=112509 RepID=A0A8I6WDQ6_HORVV
MPPLIYTLLGLLLLSHAAPRCSSAGDTLVAGQTLAAVGVGAGKLVSRNGKYALGFFQPATMISSPMSSSKSHHNSSSSWYFGIWFNKVPVFTTVWVANREKPIPHPIINSTQLRISSDGNLVIAVDHVVTGTESLVWSTHIVNRTQTTSTTTTLVLLNSENLVLLPTNTNTSQEMPSWQSFDHPTDAVLPGAKLGWNKVTGLSNTIISKKSLINPGLGSYSVGLEGAMGMVLKRRNNPSVVYWQFVSSTTSTLVPIIQSLVDLDPRIKGLVNPTYVDNNREEYYMYTSPDESPPLFVSLDTSGQIKMMFWSQARQTWETIGANPDGPCMTPATCGPFALCNNKAHMLCECMEGFSQKSP